MMEIDIVKASANKPIPSYYDDTDISEADTALNTPTGSLTDAFVKRFSSTSSSSSSYKAIKRKPSITPSNNKSSSPELLHKIQALEMEVNQLVENEINLKSQLLMLKQQQQKQGKQSALDRIHKHIDRFLTSNQQQRSDKNANDLIGSELPALFDENDANVNQVEFGVTSMGDTTHYPAIDIPSVLILRLKAMIDHYNKEGAREHGQGEASFCTELLSTLDTWQSYQFSAILNQQLEQKKEQDRVTRLLEALHKSLLRNKLMQKDMNMLTKQYKSNLKSMLKDQEQHQHYQKPTAKKRRTSTATAAVLHDHCEKTRLLLECQIQNLEMALCTCQDERDEYETTLEMVRREMETMLEELEDTRQQRLRYKTQASRLRAGLEAIQKKKRKTSAYHSGDTDEDEDEEEEEEEEEDEATEAIRLMYNEAERQAVDLDRECKRQALTLDSIRKELKLTEEKYQVMKAEKNKQTKKVEQSNRNLTRRIEMLELQLTTNSKSDISVSTTKNNTEQRSDSQDHEHDHEENLLLYHAKIHALQIALKAAKSDAIVQRTRICQLERQSMLDPAQYIVRMQDMFKKELALSTTEPSVDIHKRLADRIEFEQREWKQRQWTQFQKKFDMDLLRVNREILTLSSRLTEIEMEAEITQSRHKEAMALVRHQVNMDFEHKLHKLMALQQRKERALQDQLEVLNQKNQTLQDESMILYGRNMMMAHKLGKIA